MAGYIILLKEASAIMVYWYHKNCVWNSTSVGGTCQNNIHMNARTQRFPAEHCLGHLLCFFQSSSDVHMPTVSAFSGKQGSAWAVSWLVFSYEAQYTAWCNALCVLKHFYYSQHFVLLKLFSGVGPNRIAFILQVHQ